MMKYARYLLAALAAIILVGCLPAKTTYAMYEYDEKNMEASVKREIKKFHRFHVIPTSSMKKFKPGKQASYGDVLTYFCNGIAPTTSEYVKQDEAWSWMRGIAYELSLDYPEEPDVIYGWITDGKYDAFNLNDPANMDWVYRIGYLLCRYYMTEATSYVFKDAVGGFEYDFNNGYFKIYTAWDQGPSQYTRRYFGIEIGTDYAKRYLVIAYTKVILAYCEQATRSEKEVIF